MILKKIFNWFSYLYFHYQLITCLYMFEPWERFFLNITILLTALLIIYSSITYLPHYTVSFFSSVRNVTHFVSLGYSNSHSFI